ncbi:helix-turn-helix transcriptional regulator [Phytobacter sp. V91]|uniref:helix-turn-helix transcriptional regulator n=1 Tax=Phytobacter sp. V91 TaxID=3369425 RepID=UPI003F5F04BF
MTFTVADVSPSQTLHTHGDVIASAALSGITRGRAQICTLVWPRMKIAAHTRKFHFFEPTLLLVLGGRLDFTAGQSTGALLPWSHLGLVDQHTEADFSKYPQSETAPFRSLFLTFNPQLVERFNQTFCGTTHRNQARTALIATSPTLLGALDALIVSLGDASLSDERVTLRVFDLLMVLKEHGFQFSPGQSSLVSRRLMSILNDSPERNWTAGQAAESLAMSESTLRRKLKAEEAGFEQILLETRMHHGLMLIQTTPWNMVQIADACGYKSVARFSERFKQRFGTTPARFR